MADLLIKNVELPKSGAITLYVEASGKVRFQNAMGSTLAVEVPKHGRLIDADMATNEIRKFFCGECSTKNDSDKCWTCTVNSCIRLIDDEQTILEANK